MLLALGRLQLYRDLYKFCTNERVWVNERVNKTKVMAAMA
jgi:hypothetical protein